MKGVLICAIFASIFQASFSTIIQNANSPQRVTGEYLITLQPLRGVSSRSSKMDYARAYEEQIQNIGQENLEILNRYIFNRLIIISIRCYDTAALNAIAELPQTKAIEANTRNYAI